MALYPNYLRDFTEFARRTSSRSGILQLLEGEAGKWCFKCVHCLVSIGCSDGDYDAQIISRCMPHLKYYEAVDVDPEALQRLQATNLQSLLDYQVLTHCVKAEEWTGPTYQPDVINVMHVLYYIENWAGFLGKCLAWLKPGGCMIIGLAHENSFTDSYKKTSGKERLSSKVRRWSHPSIESYQEHIIRGTFDLRGVVKSTLNIVTNKEADLVETDTFINDMENTFGDIANLPEDGVIWLVKKKANCVLNQV